MSELEIFVALLMAMLAIAGIMGGAIYKIISKTVEEDMMSLARAQHHITLATVNLIDSLKDWTDYQATNNFNKLNQTIERTEEAYDLHATHLDDQVPETEKLICWIKNNLAYYLAERKKLGKALPGDDALAKQCAKYSYDRIHKYPENSDSWADTYQFVQKQFP